MILIGNEWVPKQNIHVFLGIVLMIALAWAAYFVATWKR